MRSKITSPRTLAACTQAAKFNAGPIAETRTVACDIGRQIAEVRARRAAVNSNTDGLERQAQAVLTDHNALQGDDIGAGLQPRPMSRENTELVRRARQMAAATPAALEKLAREESDLLVGLTEARAAFSGAVFASVRERQKAAQLTITDAVAAVAPALAELLALGEIQRKYCGGERTMKLSPGEAPPFSGDVVVKNFTDRLPLQFKSSAIELLKLTEQSADRVKELVAEIEGFNQ